LQIAPQSRIWRRHVSCSVRAVRPVLLALAAFPLIVACGKGASDSLQDDAGSHPSADDSGAHTGCSQPASFTCDLPCNAGTTAPTCINETWECPGVGSDCEDAGSPCGPTTEECELPCGGGFTGPVCTTTGWQCPVFNGGICPEDAGPCGAPPPDFCKSDDPCTDWSLQCLAGGAWACVPTPIACSDASTDDASPEDAGEALFACGSSACDPGATFCAIVVGGPVADDGGASSSYYCLPLPTTCAGESASCACVSAGEQSPGACGCIQSSDHVIVTCDLN
jgi:hypothetical protein